MTYHGLKRVYLAENCITQYLKCRTVYSWVVVNIYEWTASIKLFTLNVVWMVEWTASLKLYTLGIGLLAYSQILN